MVTNKGLIYKKRRIRPLSVADLGVANKVQLITAVSKERIGYLTRDISKGLSKGVSRYFFNATRKTEKIGKGSKIDLHCSVEILDTEDGKSYMLNVETGKHLVMADFKIPRDVNETYKGMGEIAFRDAMALLKNSKKAPEIDGIFGIWLVNENYYKEYGGKSINLIKFWDAVEKGKAYEEAAFATITGKWAKSLGYTIAKIQGIPQKEAVIVKFYKPKNE